MMDAADSATAGGRLPLLEHLREMISAGLEYAQARLELAGLETKEALVHFGIIIGLLLAAVGVVVFGYLFLCIGVVVLLAELFQVGLGWMVLGLGVIHFVLAAAFLLIAKNRFGTPVFQGTIAELKKDQQWLSPAKQI